jgi:hypothetical protein
MGIYRAVILVAAGVMMLTACAPVSDTGTSAEPTPLPCDAEVSWDEAIEILHTRQVDLVVQLHSLQVTFMLKNGCRITTVEPRIDDIFKELEKCEDSCGVTSVATE